MKKNSGRKDRRRVAQDKTRCKRKTRKEKRTVSMYDRQRWLDEKNNTIKASGIEFVLKRAANG